MTLLRRVLFFLFLLLTIPTVCSFWRSPMNIKSETPPEDFLTPEMEARILRRLWKDPYQLGGGSRPLWG
ncbi:unnamed protein product, partial [Mesorhabditis spiculigera]